MLTFDWIRSYDVDQPFDEVVDFFKDRMPKRGWRLVQEKSYKESTYLIFKGRFPWSEKIEIYVLKLEPGKTLVDIFPHAD